MFRSRGRSFDELEPFQIPNRSKIGPALFVRHQTSHFFPSEASFGVQSHGRVRWRPGPVDPREGRRVVLEHGPGVGRCETATGFTGELIGGVRALVARGGGRRAGD
ncbi:hypothetical protein AAFF_G00087750 [Aldrovandia affinis]|uniref:Uncharacterized protein n=1 Tax=Aldrovandia affinis TaxID=143900 RepID=A0AAD7WD70_9TELE|nr:hypothetical protein AAFF_G00087750 [Aldrovandia affinis]